MKPKIFYSLIAAVSVMVMLAVPAGATSLSGDPDTLFEIPAYGPAYDSIPYGGEIDTVFDESQHQNDGICEYDPVDDRCPTKDVSDLPYDDAVKQDAVHSEKSPTDGKSGQRYYVREPNDLDFAKRVATYRACGLLDGQTPGSHTKPILMERTYSKNANYSVARLKALDNYNNFHFTFGWYDGTTREIQVNNLDYGEWYCFYGTHDFADPSSPTYGDLKLYANVDFICGDKNTICEVASGNVGQPSKYIDDESDVALMNYVYNQYYNTGGDDWWEGEGNNFAYVSRILSLSEIQADFAEILEADEYCGDGEVNGNEECDDGNNQDGDGCNQYCQLEYCGDGILQPGLGEECDDGNNDDGDGCSADCKIEEDPGDGFNIESDKIMYSERDRIFVTLSGGVSGEDFMIMFQDVKAGDDWYVVLNGQLDDSGGYLYTTAIGEGVTGPFGLTAFTIDQNGKTVQSDEIRIFISKNHKNKDRKKDRKFSIDR